MIIMKRRSEVNGMAPAYYNLHLWALDKPSGFFVSAGYKVILVTFFFCVQPLPVSGRYKILGAQKSCPGILKAHTQGGVSLKVILS